MNKLNTILRNEEVQGFLREVVLPGVFLIGSILGWVFLCAVAGV